VAVTPRYERNAIPDEDRDHADDELVDRLFVKKGGDELASANYLRNSIAHATRPMAMNANPPQIAYLRPGLAV
jgi:hypothetical protein